MTDKEDSIKVQDIDHCGIVAGIIDRIGLVDVINEKLGTHPLQTISPGITVKAMILNGLNVLSAPLYLFSNFFVGKATEHLLGEGIQPEHLNDGRKHTAIKSSTLVIKSTCQSQRSARVNVTNSQ